MLGLLRLRDPLSQLFKISQSQPLSLSLCMCVYIYVCICIFCVLCPLVILLQNPNVQFSLQLWAVVKDKEVWRAAVRGVTKAVQDLATQRQCASAWQMFHLC